MRMWEDLLRLAQGVRRRWRGLALLLLALVGVGLAAPHLNAWHHYRAGKTALERYHADEALEHFSACLRTWPESKEARLLAARAARRADRLDEAVTHLEVCDKHWATAEDVLLEWALQRAAAGDLPSVDPFLHSRLRNHFQPDGALICEALAVGCLRMYRFHTAILYLTQWLEQEPDNVQALFLRARVLRARNKLPEAISEFRRVLELDPQRDDARYDLAFCLMDMRTDTEETLSLLEKVYRQRPNDPDLFVHMAVCYHVLGKTQQARETLDRVLRDHPAHGLALRERGRQALQDEQPTDAERWLRQALAIRPYDIQVHLDLAKALQRQQKTAEAETEKSRADQLQSWLKRLQKISHKELVDRPYDPILHSEIGILETRLGRPNRGYRWLQLALSEAPNAAPVHAALAEYYEQLGDSHQAATHRQLAQEASGPSAKK